jgi:hypothetical protein
MEKLKTFVRSALMLMLVVVLLNACSKTAARPNDEMKGPSETVVLNLVDVNNQEVGSLYIDNMNGRAQARISMDSGYYTAGQDMKTNITLTTTAGTTLYANCTDVSGGNGKCSTFPIKVLKNNSDALFKEITGTEGIVFNVLDRNNNVFARSTQHAIVIDN